MASRITGGHWTSFRLGLKTGQLHHHPFHAGGRATRSTGRRKKISMSGTQTSAPRAYVGLPAAAKDHYYTLGVNPGASEEDIKKAYRRLALQYHPDVCQGDLCETKFMQINKAYESVLNGVLSYEARMEDDFCTDLNAEGLMGVNDDSWEDWEEWMGWEGAGIRDYSSHINHAL